MAEKKLVKLEDSQLKENRMTVTPEAPAGYAGPGIYPTPQGDALIGKVAEARLRGIYEAYGRNQNAIAKMRLDPAYASARAAGIQLPGDGMRGTSKTASLSGSLSEELVGGGSRGTRYRDAGAGMRASGEAKTLTESQYAGPSSTETTKGQRLTTPQPQASSVGPALAPEPAATPEANSPPRPMKDPTVPETQNAPEAVKPPTVESTKGPRITTRREDLGITRGVQADENRRVASIPFDNSAYNSNLEKRDRISSGNVEPMTAAEMTARGYREYSEKDPNSVVSETDASVKMARASDKNDLQDQREGMKKDYDAKVQSEARKDPFAKYRTEAGDTEIAQRTGEVQDRSRYGEDGVAGRKSYTNQAGREMIGNTMQRPDGSTYFAGLPSADQNKADAFNRNVGSNFNQYNNFSASPRNYKANAEDMRANYAFGGGSGPGGSLIAQDEEGMTGRNRSELTKDTGSLSAGSNFSGIASRGQQSPDLDKSSTLTMRDILPSEPKLPNNQEFKGPESEELKRKQREVAKTNSKTIAI